MQTPVSNPRQPTLEVRNLTTRFDARAGIATAVNAVSFRVMPGQIMGDRKSVV